jgi:hypothetical protein
VIAALLAAKGSRKENGFDYGLRSGIAGAERQEIFNCPDAKT